MLSATNIKKTKNHFFQIVSFYFLYPQTILSLNFKESIIINHLKIIVLTKFEQWLSEFAVGFYSSISKQRIRNFRFLKIIK